MSNLRPHHPAKVLNKAAYQLRGLHKRQGFRRKGPGVVRTSGPYAYAGKRIIERCHQIIIAVCALVGFVVTAEIVATFVDPT